MKSKKPLVLVTVPENVRFVFMNTLLQEYFHVIRAVTGAETLQYCDEHLPDMVMMDIKLPDMNVLKVFDAIREKYPVIPLVAMSDNELDDAKNELLDYGFDGYIGSPIDLNNFEHNVMSMLRSRLQPPAGNNRKMGKLTVLVAEDDAMNFRLDTLMLKDSFVLYHAWDGEEAIEMTQRIKPDIVLMDIRMPRMDGVEATREILKINPRIAVVALSAFLFKDEKEKYEKMGFDGFLIKPCHADDLPRILRDVYNNKVGEWA